MNEDLEQKLRELRTDARTFFRIAHLRVFGTDPDMTRAALEYEISGTVPLHVLTFLSIINKEQSDAMQKMQGSDRRR